MTWEYKCKVSGPYRDHEHELNLEGLQEWELVGVHVDSGAVHTYFFKRALAEDALDSHTEALRVRADEIAKQDEVEQKANEEFAVAQAAASERREKKLAAERAKREALLLAAQAASAASDEGDV